MFNMLDNVAYPSGFQTVLCDALGRRLKLEKTEKRQLKIKIFLRKQQISLTE
jgi:hypothetical protein